MYTFKNTVVPKLLYGFQGRAKESIMLITCLSAKKVKRKITTAALTAHTDLENTKPEHLKNGKAGRCKLIKGTAVHAS